MFGAVLRRFPRRLAPQKWSAALATLGVCSSVALVSASQGYGPARACSHEDVPPPPPSSAPPPSSSASLVLRQKVIDTCLQMNAMGINQGTSGNVSVRVEGGFLITPSGVPYANMTPDMIVFVDDEGGYYGALLPSSEWRMHYDLYRHRPQAKAIVHAHPTFATALACNRRTIPAFHYMVAAAGGKSISCADYATFGSQELSDNMMVALSGDRRACLMANHGMIAYGNSLDKALWLANETECLARQYLESCRLGPPVNLSDEEITSSCANFRLMGSRLRRWLK